MNEKPKINYYDVSIEELKKIPEGVKPKLLLHACCGPCSCFPLTFLCPRFEVTIYYGNSNIFPKEEYVRRLEELKKLLLDLKRDYGYEVNLVIPEYDYDSYMEELRPYKDEPECGKRCRLCYAKRMKEAYGYAESNGFDYFTTVMTISRQKSSQTMNEIGQELELQFYKTKYFYSDFKKHDGILKGKAMRLKYDLYNQLYCGCEYSYNLAQERIAKYQKMEQEKE